MLDGDEYVINGEKIYVTSGDRADHIVVWATLDRDLGRAAIKSFVVAKGTPGMRVDRLEHKLGIRASDTATIIFEDCRVPKENLLGSPEIDPKGGFAGRDGDLRQHPPAGRRDGGRLRHGRARPHPRAARRGRRGRRLRPAGAPAVRGGREGPPDGGRPRGAPGC